jgi:hypothetical protein
MSVSNAIGQPFFVSQAMIALRSAIAFSIFIASARVCCRTIDSTETV